MMEMNFLTSEYAKFKALGGGGQAIFATFLSLLVYYRELSFLFPTVYNMYMAKLYGSSSILAQTRVVVKAGADFLYCFI